VILLLDANVLLSDPMCDGKVWDVLAHAPEPWKLRVLVTDVVLAETAGRYEDTVSSAIEELRKLTKGWGRLGLGEATSSAEAVGQMAIAQYRVHLCDSLSAARAEVIPPADVPHMQLVARSVARRRPCDDKGDGYRDTLNWLTVLDLAQANENETLAWVSKDKDFWNDSNNGFHEDLVEDLESVGALGRVRLIKDLWDAVLELAAEFSSDAEDMAVLGHELQEQTVLKYLESSLSENLEQFHLNARAVGLPLETQGVVVRSIDDFDELTYELKGGVAEGEAVAGFAVTAQFSMTLTLPVEAAVDYPLDQIVSTSDGTALVALRKPLVFRGVLQLGRYDRPLGVETTSIEAKPEDAGLALWRLLDRQESGLAMKNLGVQSDAISKFLAQSGGMKNLGVQSDAIRARADRAVRGRAGWGRF
jgi:PIN domain